MPNVVVVLADQMRRDALGCAGNANLRTPNLDRLAERGVRFTAACATFPACVPFRFSLLTGEYAHSRNVPALGYRLSPAERTLGDALEAAGLATAYIGKWHLYSAYGVSGGMSLSQASRTPI
ncbi:MAG: sulfatase-like hydrolase/transferase, partial [Geminicoccaceae bacterium]|nr:sulfatase-like hydrolase/transferase [Geminicoccaceae bacterium]